MSLGITPNSISKAELQNIASSGSGSGNNAFSFSANVASYATTITDPTSNTNQIATTAFVLSIVGDINTILSVI